MKTVHYIFITIVLLLLFSSCNVTKNLQEDEFLITKTTIKYENPDDIRNRKTFRGNLEGVVTPQPNGGTLKLPLAIYQWGEKSNKEKGLKKWMQKNFGEAPALYDEQEQQRNRLRLKKLLKDNGFFRSDIAVDSILRGKKVEMVYSVYTEGQYKINNVFLPLDTTSIGKIISDNKSETLIKEGDFYSEVLMAEERSRISEQAAEKGYMDFNNSYVYYFVDTIPETLKVDVYVRIKEPARGGEHLKYSLGETRVYPNYDLSDNEYISTLDTVFHKPDFLIVTDKHVMDHKVLDRMILQDSGAVISKRLQSVSVSHLLDLGIYKFVNLKYERAGDSLNPMVNRTFYLTPDYNQNVAGNFELNNRTGNFYGIGASASYSHQNLFKKAIVFNTSISGGLETQTGNSSTFLNTADLNAELKLSTPRFVFPYKFRANKGLYVPRSSLAISNNFQRRISLYSINSTNLKLGYQWRYDDRRRHELYPISINRIEVLDKTQDFTDFLSDNPRLSNSFRNLLIGGLDYTYVYTSQIAGEDKDYWFFRTNVRTAGNLPELAGKAVGLKEDSNGQLRFLGLAFAQFSSVEFDVRFYKKFRKGLLANRFAPSIGYAYGNSTVMPYTEQFFVGGANSIRAFRIREIGPGSFARDNVLNDDITNQFFDQTGDFKLEFSSEYRFPIFGFFKGAVFADVGNVWLVNDDEDVKEYFEINNFWKELAVGTGFGLRLDIEYIVLRLDISTALRRPYFNEGFQWTFDRMDFRNQDWRRENIIYNLAVGYPF
ncbi:MAG: BamA/TamA family outer membrane protein [Saprospiraceae bacterium]